MEVNTMKALKKIIIIVLTAIMLVSVLSVPASASSPVKTAQLTVSAYNIKLKLAEAIAANANAAIVQLVTIAQNQTNPDIDALIAQTNAISALAILLINALGFDAVCEYVEYEIAGQIVAIDPIIVIPIGGGGTTT
jgi:hypothetical protein